MKKHKAKKIIKKIVAIGGGEIVTENGDSQTKAIDREIIRLSGKMNPRLLFIPTASRDSAGYCNNMLNYFGTELGCDVKFLLLYSQTDKDEIKKKIENADIIYVGGGNTYAMMRRWRSLGVDKMLLEAYERGTVMSGLSAGAICWFRYGASNSRKFKNPKASMIRVSALGLVNAIFCPHYNLDEYGDKNLSKLLARSSQKALAIDERCAIEIIDDEFRIIASDKSANAYLAYFRKNEYISKKIPIINEFVKLSSLLRGD